MHPDRMRICGDCESPLLPFAWKASGKSCECLTPSAILRADSSVWHLFTCHLPRERNLTRQALVGDTYAPIGALVWCSYWGDYYRVLDHHDDGTVSVATVLEGWDAGLDRIRRHRTPLDKGRDVWANMPAMIGGKV